MRLYHFVRRLSTAAVRFNKEKLINEVPEKDRFLEMMDDRTYSLFRTLKIDVDQLKREVDEPPKKVIEIDPLKQIASMKPPETDVKNYFDTQEVYSELRYAGLTNKQADIIMRTMHSLINNLVQSCTSRAVPVSAGANEAYLFDAASSEVRNEISNSRQSHSTTYRSTLSRLQRDVEILEHEAAEMTNLLKADLDIEVHERKNSARAEENIIQLKIQELHNKISTRLNSDLKSEIENLRWQITRRSLTAIGVIAGSLIWLTQTNSQKKVQGSYERELQSGGTLVQVPVLAPSVGSGEVSVPLKVEDIDE